MLGPADSESCGPARRKDAPFLLEQVDKMSITSAIPDGEEVTHNLERLVAVGASNRLIQSRQERASSTTRTYLHLSQRLSISLLVELLVLVQLLLSGASTFVTAPGHCLWSFSFRCNFFARVHPHSSQFLGISSEVLFPGLISCPYAGTSG